MTESALNPELKKALDKLVKENNVVLFMKGSKDFPQCGFSARVVQVLDMLETDYIDINVLEDMAIREGIKEYTQWPTVPQLYIDGEFIGGCDIITEAFKNGELQEMLNKKAS